MVATTPSVLVPTPYNNITATIAPNVGGPADADSTNNSAARNLTVSPDGVDLSVTKTKTPAIVALNANITSAIVVRNAGPRTAASGTITLVDALDPAMEEFVSYSGTNWACTSVPPSVNCTYNASLGIGNSATLTIVTKAIGVGAATNVATSSYSGVPGDYDGTNNAGSATITVTAEPNSPDLLVGVSVATAGGTPNRVESNETQVTYTATLTNKVIPTAADARDVRITLSIPGRRTTTNVLVAGVVLTNTSGTSNAAFACVGTGTRRTGGVTCTQTAGTVLSPGDVVTFSVTADRPMNNGNFTGNSGVTASASSTTQGDPLPGDNTARADVFIDPIADVEVVSKVLAANPVLAGTQAVYTVTLRNNGPSSAAGVELADVFTIPGGDSGFTFISASASNSGVCSGLSANTSYNTGAPTVTCSWAAALTSGATRTVTVTVRPNWQTGVLARTLDNTATVSTTTPEDSVGGQGTAPNSKSLTLNINPAQVDVLINNTDTFDPLGYDPTVPANNDITYDVAATNNGPSLATGTGFSFVMTPPAGKTVSFRGDGATAGVAAANPGGTIPGSLCDQLGNSVTGPAALTVTCAHPSPAQLISGQTLNRFLVFRVESAPNTGGDTYNTAATTIINETDTNGSNNVEGESTTVRVRADLSITKSPSVATVQLRQPFNWTVVVTNAGPGDSQTTGLTDTLPSGMVFGAATPTWALSGGGSGTCAVVGQAMTCAFGLVPAGQAVTVTVPAVRVMAFPSGGTTQNCASATTSEVDPVSTNNVSVCSSLTVQRSTLAGTIFEDRDRVGANAGTPQAAGIEPRIAGVTVTLSGVDAYGNAVSRTTTTDGSGAYSFTDLSPADATGYALTETQPASYLNGPASPPTPATSGTYNPGAGAAGNSSWSAIALAANTAGTGYDFPEVRQPSLSGFVYVDANLNGVRDAATDPAISGATVRLLDANTLAVVATTTTNGSGAYTFTGFDPFIAHVLEQPLPTLPANLANGPVNPGLIGGVACVAGCIAQPNTPAANTDRIAAIDLGTGVDGAGFNFGEIQLTTVAGTVYIDRNRNNTLDPLPTDGRLPGVTVRLMQGANCATGTMVQSTATDGSGNYSFGNVVSGGNYLLCETQPAGYGNGTENPGTAATSPGINVIAITSLPLSGSTGNHFGERAALISGSVYADLSPATPANTNNGIRDPGEAGIEAVPVALTGRDIQGLAVNRSTFTDASGNYDFDDLLQSDATGYTVTEGTIPPAAGTYSDGRERVGSAGGSAAVNDVISGIVLGAGAQGVNYDFGELPISLISGTVYVDRNRDNALNPVPTDGRLPGVTVRLVQGVDCSSGATLQTASTDADGNYSFPSVGAGANYLLCETQPPGYGNGVENPGTAASTPGANVIAITSLPLSGSTGNHFGERTALIAGAVYADHSPNTPANTNNGFRDAGESGIPAVPVTLTGRNVLGAAVSLSTVTDSSGNYAFGDLLQSDTAGYTLTEGDIPPASGSFNDGRERVGSAGGNAAINDVISGIVLGAGAAGVDYNFGELPIAPITGTVYIDRNRDNKLDPTPNDGRIENVEIMIRAGTSCAGDFVALMRTDANGNYAFTGMAIGLTYTLCERQPAGYGDGAVNPGNHGSSPAPNTIVIASLPAEGSAGNHFGEHAGSIAGSVYLDADNDGVRSGAESGLAGVAVTLTGPDAGGNALTRVAITDISGHYRFEDLPGAGPGGYVLTEQSAQPQVGATVTLNGRTRAGQVGGSPLGAASNTRTAPSTISAITLAPGADSVLNEFGEILPVSISGTVFLDVNNDGVQSLPGDTGLGSVAIVITGTDDDAQPVTRTTATLVDGTYKVMDLRPGSYTVTEPSQPPGTSNGRTIPGSAGGVATGPGDLPSAVTGIVLTSPGANSDKNNFAEIETSRFLSGRVWIDANNDGVIDATEVGIPGVSIVLHGVDAAGRAINQTTTTDATGAYQFNALPPGTYAVTEPIQPASTVNGITRAGSTGGTATPVATLPSAISGIALTSGTGSAANNFGELPAASISGFVYRDHDDDGIRSPGEQGIPGVAVQLTGIDDAGRAVSAGASTSGDGGYHFGGLRPGSYTVTEPNQPEGTVNGRTTPGNLGGSATPVNVKPSAVSGITLTYGAHSAENNFGELGDAPDLRVSKSHSEARFTVSRIGTYKIVVRNSGAAPTVGSYSVSDRLPPGLTLAAAPRGNGWECTGSANDSSFSCTSSIGIAGGGVSPNAITAVVNVGELSAATSSADNVVLVEGGGENEANRPTPAERAAFLGNPGDLPVCSGVVEHNACRTPTPVDLEASLSGTVWFDVGPSERLLDADDRRLPGWLVEVTDAGSGAVAGTAITGIDGTYVVTGLMPGVPLVVRFRDPVSGVVFGYPVNGETAPGSSGAPCNPGVALGGLSSCVERIAKPELTVVLAPGQRLPQQSMPVDPSGVVYDALTRKPVPGSVVTLAPSGNGVCAGWQPKSALVGANLGGYTVDGDAVSMTVGADGFYQFLFAPGAPAICTFALTVTPPADHLFVSTLIAPTTGPLVPGGEPGSIHAVQPQGGPPTAPVGVGTTYYLLFNGGSAGANIIHNHLPVDPSVPAGIALTKTGDRQVVEVGGTLRYSIAVNAAAGSRPRQTTVIDRLPAGFTYVRGTAMVGNAAIDDPRGGAGPTLAFNLGPMVDGRPLLLRYRVRIGVGAREGDGVNRARAFACGDAQGCVGADFAPYPSSVASNEGRYQVRVTGGVFADESCVLGKIFVDCNGNHVQDAEEIGIPGVRLVMSDGTTVIADSEGKYSVCGVAPRSQVLRVDPMTLPKGARLTTSSNRNLGDAGSLWLDLKHGELHRADFVEGSCSNRVLDQVKARRAQGEVRAPESEKGPRLRFDSKAHGLEPWSSPRQGTDAASQAIPKPRNVDEQNQGGSDVVR